MQVQLTNIFNYGGQYIFIRKSVTALHYFEAPNIPHILLWSRRTTHNLQIYTVFRTKDYEIISYTYSSKTEDLTGADKEIHMSLGKTCNRAT